MTTPTLTQPALKEWSAAVHAMLDGRQTVLLRKGGIGEKRFDLEASEFLFFPTVAGPITVSYNLSGVDNLQLSAETLAGIYKNDIKT